MTTAKQAELDSETDAGGASHLGLAALRQALRVDAPVYTPHAVPHFPMASLDYGD